MASVFFAFSGYASPNFEIPRKVLREGYEIWDLSKISFDDFVRAIQVAIPPVNANVTEEKNYRKDLVFKRDMAQVYTDCRWGVLLPIPGERSWGFDEESLFSLNLFSPEFLYPMFTAEDLGLKAPHIKQEKFIGIRGVQEHWDLFNENFVTFHERMLPALPLTQWVLDRVEAWSVEDYRVWNACMLFNELKRYHNSKRPWLAGLEYTEQGVILETLFTLADERTEITYRLKKRMAVLLQHIFPTIEADIHELYKRRSKYVHGTAFTEIQRSGQDYGRMVDFEFSRKCTKYLRFAITAYLYVHKSGFIQQAGHACMVDLLEAAILDSNLRARLVAKVDEVCRLIPG